MLGGNSHLLRRAEKTACLLLQEIAVYYLL